MNWKDFDWVTISVLFCLAILSLAALYPYSVLNGGSFFLRQLVFFLVGFFLLFSLSFLNISFLKKQRIFIFALYLFGVALLALVLAIGAEVRGTQSWFFFLPFISGKVAFQPSEAMKIIVIFILARYLTFRHAHLYKLRDIFISAFYAGIPAVLIALQPDLGSAVVILFLWFGIIVMAGLPLRRFLLILLLGMIAVGIMWVWFLEPYQKLRVVSFLNPEADPLGANYSRIQSLIAIGAGGIFGRGFGANVHSLDGFLPEAHTDFMFSMLAEALGFTGVLIILALYGILVFRLLRFEGKSNFDRLFASSLGLLIFIQASINIAIALGLLPVTGLTLPFLSYGGSSLISLFIGLGIYQALYVRS
ncbi:MAG: rod shape-determining protein RodA [Candidatus Portnoybacteria bacterium]|nr:rod shape-determining protein RodA [Candidatus Portnoybacteria bacterium]